MHSAYLAMESLEHRSELLVRSWLEIGDECGVVTILE